MKDLIIGILILSIILCFLIYGMQDNFALKKYTQEVDSLENMPNPKQEIIKNPQFENVIVNQQQVSIQKIATYDISGRVLATREYKDQVGSYDVALGWGILTVDDNYKKVTSWEFEERAVTCSIKDETWLKSVGGFDAVMRNYSHNHLIPSNDEMRKIFPKIRIGDYIRVKGYLVYARWGNTEWGPSSLVRDDTGCEIIYVKDFKLLKKK